MCQTSSNGFADLLWKLGSKIVNPTPHYLTEFTFWSIAIYARVPWWYSWLQSKKDVRFRGTLESTFSEPRKKGVGAEVKRTPVITKEEEDQLWRAGVMAIDTLKQLLNTVFFYVGKVFCLRGGVEQRGLKISQFQRRYSPDHYVYVENGSKTTREPTLGLKTRLSRFIQIQNVCQDVLCLCLINTSQNCHH